MTRRHWVFLSVCLIVVALGAVILVWFQPQKLAIDNTVNETAPPAATSATVAQGNLVPLNHEAAGKAIAVEASGGRTLRFEDFAVENGPDLVVYLSAAEPSAGRALGDDFVDLGVLKANKGNQNYEIPAGTDLQKYKTAVVWCRRFTVAFAAATLA